MPTVPDGPVQNVVMVNHPVFLVANVKDYLTLEQSRLGLGNPTQLLTKGRFNPMLWNWNSLTAFTKSFTQPPSHPAAYTYYSMVPFRFGEWIASWESSGWFLPIERNCRSINVWFTE